MRKMRLTNISRQRSIDESPEFKLAPEDSYDGRCGEIFITVKRFLVFHCSLCDRKYGDFSTLLDHISDQHFKGIQSNVQTNFADNEYDAELRNEFVDEELFDCDDNYREDNSVKEYQGQTNVNDEETLEYDDEVYDMDEDNIEMKEEEIKSENDYLSEKAKENCVEKVTVDEICTSTDVYASEVNGPNECSIPSQEQQDSMEQIQIEFIVAGRIDESSVKNDDSERATVANLRKKGTGGPDQSTCQICGKHFSSKKILKKHHEVHSTERKYKCEFCGLAFKTYTTFHAHKRRHFSDKKKFPCDFCPKKFYTTSEAISHMRMHTGDRPYICAYCGLGFQTSSKLTLHSRRHTEKELKCTECDKAFFGKKALDQHMVVHDHQKPFVCCFCTRNFAGQRALMKHLAKNHCG